MPSVHSLHVGRLSEFLREGTDKRFESVPVPFTDAFAKFLREIIYMHYLQPLHRQDWLAPCLGARPLG